MSILLVPGILFRPVRDWKYALLHLLEISSLRNTHSASGTDKTNRISPLRKKNIPPRGLETGTSRCLRGNLCYAHIQTTASHSCYWVEVGLIINKLKKCNMNSIVLSSCFLWVEEEYVRICILSWFLDL